MPSLISLLSSFEIIGAATAYTLGLVSYTWITIFMTTFIQPLLSKFLKKDVGDIVINIFNTKFKVGNFIVATIDFALVILFILFVLKVVLKNVVQKIINDKNEHEDKIVKFLEDITKWKIHFIKK